MVQVSGGPRCQSGPLFICLFPIVWSQCPRSWCVSRSRRFKSAAWFPSRSDRVCSVWPLAKDIQRYKEGNSMRCGGGLGTKMKSFEGESCSHQNDLSRPSTPPIGVVQLAALVGTACCSTSPATGKRISKNRRSPDPAPNGSRVRRKGGRRRFGGVLKRQRGGSYQAAQPRNAANS